MTALDALQIINRLSPTGPILAARLVNDSAAGNTQNLDFITNAYSLEFGVTHGDGNQQLEIRINGTGDDPFTIAGSFGDSPVLVGEAQLDVIAGTALGDGDQRFEARIAGESVTRTFVVTIDKSAPAAPVALRLTSATDTGLNNADGITNALIPVVEGDADADSLVTLMVDGQVVGHSATGSPFRIPAGALDEGTHSATATAEDLAGNFSTASTAFDFEVDRTPPEVPAFDLRPDSDTAPQGDSITTASRVSLTGQTSPGARVELLESASLVTADGGGVFQFDRVRLKLGSNPLTARHRPGGQPA